MKTITIHRLRSILASLDRATPIGLTVMTDADMRVRDNPYRGAKKLVKLNAMVGTNHEVAVQRQQAREGVDPTFMAAPRKWGVRVAPALVEHKGAYYLPAQLNPIHKPRPLYLVPRERGNRTVLTSIPKETLAPWLTPDRDESAYQGVNRPVVHRDIRLDHIVTASIGGERYRVRAD